MATYTIHQIPTARAALLTDELEVQATGGGQSARVTAASLSGLISGPTGATGASGATGATGGGSITVTDGTTTVTDVTAITTAGLPVIDFGGGNAGIIGVGNWNSGIMYSAEIPVFDRGAIWMSTTPNTNSEPISGNADWMLVGGTPYVDVLLTPVILTTAPFFDATQTGPGLLAIPAPGAGFYLDTSGNNPLVPSPGDDWGSVVNVNLTFRKLDNVLWDGGYGSGDAHIDDGTLGAIVNSYSDNTPVDIWENRPVVLYTQDDLVMAGVGSRYAVARIYYNIVPIPVASFYSITGVNQGTKTFTVSDANADLNGATGSIIVTGSTGNDGTYTIVSAVSGAGSTVITVVEPIPSATADGWVNQ